MPEKGMYSSYYETGAAARKRAYIETPESRNNNIKRKYGKNKLSSKNEKKTNSNVSKAVTMLSIAFVFSMIMIITYRYNVISEKNLTSQTLKSELEVAEANLLNAKISVDQETNLDYIEAYAKQKLGMQKPVSSQIIYVDTSGLKNDVVENKDLSEFASVFSKIKEALKGIF